MTEKMIFAGFGGQGVMFLGKMFAYAGMLEDKHVTWIPSYGPEMRGGTANCSVIVSDEEIGEPVVVKPTVLVAMNEPSLGRFLPSLQPGGLLVINSSLIDATPDRDDIRVLRIPANDLAREVGQAGVANVVVLGALLRHLDIVSKESIVEAIKKNSPAGRPEVLETNLRALQAGEGAA